MSPPIKKTSYDNMAKARRGDNHYVKNSEFYDALDTWYKSGSERIPDKITLAIMQICERLGKKGNFCNYTYRDDMVASAISVCFVAVKCKKFNTDAPQKNPFAYFTQIAYNEMVRMIKAERVHSYIKHAALSDHITTSMLNGQPVESMFEDDRNYDLIRQFQKDPVVGEQEIDREPQQEDD